MWLRSYNLQTVQVGEVPDKLDKISVALLLTQMWGITEVTGKKKSLNLLVTINQISYLCAAFANNHYNANPSSLPVFHPALQSFILECL